MRRPHTFFYIVAPITLILGPAIEGVSPPASFWPFYVVAILVAGYAFSFDSVRAKKITLVLVSVTLTITVADLFLRLTPIVFDDLIERWPRLPLVNRYVPNLHYEGERFNDLSRMTGVKAWREAKLVRVVTDADGFRNEQLDRTRPLDVIILGDSFGGGAVSQEYTWSSILARDYHLNIYNLSAPGSPWQEYINFWAEQDKLQTRKDTVIVWQMFTGNDLDEYYGSMDISTLPWCGPLRARLNRLNAWRARSPIRFLLANAHSGHDPRADVIAKDFLNGRKLLFYRPYTETALRTPEQVSSHQNYAALCATVHAMKELAAARGLKLHIVLVPAKEEVYAWVWQGSAPWTSDPAPSGFSVMLARLCAAEGIKFLDLKPRLIEESRHTYESSGQLLYWYDDTHLNTMGNVFTVSLIYNELLR
jgi:hypothetical protein